MFSLLAPYIAILASLCGLYSALYLFLKKRTKKKLVCPLRANCDKVVHSTHASVFGIPNELLGVAYYVTIGVLYAVIIYRPAIFSAVNVYYVVVLLTLAGILFSLYLVALQIIVIRAWCSWCMLSALSNIVLGICLFGLPLHGFIMFLAKHHTIWIIGHTLGFILGVGAATMADIFFFKFLRDHRISEEEKRTFETLSSMIWTGLAVLVVSGVMVFLPEQARLMTSAKFLLKIVVVGVIIVNGIALNLFVSPRMRMLSFEGTKPARRFRRLAFALGAISIVSWYSAFILGSIRSLGVYQLWHGILGYGILLAAAIIGSQVLERMMVSKYHKLPTRTEN